MPQDSLFDQNDDVTEVQAGLELDDRAGLRVVSASFLDEQKFNWDLFGGYDTLRVLTYSASVSAIVRTLDKFSFSSFECIFGFEGVLRDIKDILSFQKVIVGGTRGAT